MVGPRSIKPCRPIRAPKRRRHRLALAGIAAAAVVLDAELI
jgi:hypothetical protein